jgi:hypothetical protein
MSDSELSDDPGTPIPSDNELEQSLRREVVRATKAGADVTVKQVRLASEQRLHLPDGYYNGHEIWKDKSKSIIQDQVENERDVPSSPVLKKSKPVKQTKRKSQEPVKPVKKKRKVSEEGSEDVSSAASSMDSEEESKPPPKKQSRSKPTKQSTPVEEADSDGEDNGKPIEGHLSDSDLSVLIDEEPPKKRGKKKDSQEKPKKSKSTTKKSKSEDDPDQAEIKKLQGWLVQCGIRKVWGKELKPHDTSRAKIKHLRQMLSDAGMTARFSKEKATQIRTHREMAADIEAIQEGNERWGAEDAEEASDDARPQKKLVRGTKHFDFLSSDGEETD